MLLLLVYRFKETAAVRSFLQDDASHVRTYLVITVREMCCECVSLLRRYVYEYSYLVEYDIAGGT